MVDDSIFDSVFHHSFVVQHLLCNIDLNFNHILDTLLSIAVIHQ